MPQRSLWTQLVDDSESLGQRLVLKLLFCRLVGVLFSVWPFYLLLFQQPSQSGNCRDLASRIHVVMVSASSLFCGRRLASTSAISRFDRLDSKRGPFLDAALVQKCLIPLLQSDPPKVFSLQGASEGHPLRTTRHGSNWPTLGQKPTTPRISSHVTPGFDSGQLQKNNFSAIDLMRIVPRRGQPFPRLKFADHTSLGSTPSTFSSRLSPARSRFQLYCLRFSTV